MTCTGLWPPVATPFHADLSVDHDAFLHHCRALLDEGASGLAILGTTSEANSLSMDERMALLDAMVDAGIEPGRILPGTGACALPDAIALSRHATETGCAGVLLLPPFFYKDVPDDGLFDYVAGVIDGVGDPRLRVYLYHFPKMAGAGWSVDLIGRLLEAFPGIVVGLKDSTGEWDSAKAILSAHPDLAFFPANEALLPQAMAMGAVGCISATANVNARMLVDLLDALAEGSAPDELADAVTARRKAVAAFPLVPAVKAILGARYGSDSWNRVRPPLRPLEADARARLLADPAWAETTDPAQGGAA